ncbi:host specificity protein J [Pseudomonas sp. USHLN015]|uniref:host specificity protein J n=1 Tax=Pseudomonas sp. USHLN015 TaxID=3081296 RepID=UPI00301BBE53
MTALQAPATGAKGGKKKQRHPSIARDSTPSTAVAKLLYIYSWGEIVGPVDGLRSVMIDGTPVMAEDGSLNYPDVKWQFRPGALHQEPLEGFPEVNNELGVGVELRSGTPWVRAVTTPELSAIRLRLSWPHLQSQDSAGNINGWRIAYAVDVATDGGPFITALESEVSRKNTTKYERSHRIDLPAGSRWTVRVRRLTDNQFSSLISDSMYVESITEVIDADMTYPLTAVGAIEFDAVQFGGRTPKVSVLMRGAMIQVPANYDPELRLYSTSGPGTSGGVWDGTFKVAYTNNPAWIWYDLVTNPYLGLGQRITADMVNRWALYRIAQYCDQLVPDGQGGIEPRFTCNLYLQQQAEAHVVLQDIAAIFRGMCYWDGQQMVATADMPQDPVYSYTRASIKGPIKYTGTRWRDRRSLALVSWDNPANGFETEQEPVWDEEAMADYGLRELRMGVVGCTSLGQAQRAGDWALKTEKLQTRPVTFSVGLDGHIPRPGQVITLSDELLAGRANGGRIRAASGRIITLDREVEVPAGSRLLCNLPSGRSEAREVRFANGKQLTLAAPYSERPQPEAVWVLDAGDLAAMQFYIYNVTRPDWGSFKIEGIQYEPGKFELIDHGAVIEERPISIIPPSVQAPPGKVEISQHLAVDQGLSITTMTIAWSAAPNAVAYQVEWKWNDRDWVRVPDTGELFIDVPGIYAGQYLARVRAINALGAASLPASSMLTHLEGKKGAPPVPSFLATDSLLFGIGLRWGFPEGTADTQYTELQRNTSPTEERARHLGNFAYPQRAHSLTSLAAGAELWFRARLVDRAGNIGAWTEWARGQASSDAGPILDYLGKQVSETQLAKGLLERIELVDGPASKPGSVAARVKSESDARISADSALGKRIDSVAATSLQAAALVQGEATARADADAALGRRVDSVSATAQQASAAVQAEAKARADADGALGRRVDTIQAVANNASASVQQVSQAQVRTDGRLSAMHTIKTEVARNGQTYMAGIGVGVENTPGGMISQVLISASRFAIIDPNSGTTVYPFVVENGQIFINEAFIGKLDVREALLEATLESKARLPDGSPVLSLNFKTGEVRFGSAIPGGGRMTLNNRLLEIFDAAGTRRIRLGLWG